ncbi:vitelline membrane outer layer protein 1 homolog [Aquila chrysaetos chrysaetos]|uniref:Vitelline membrane outer layer 1 homolog n=1 Tax=Aquila chrysaetos chrysaetos TaxID=223781 RepID=A0A663F8M3_AQUCH|nr:vitelline membrane outer layer protein 1 homolog [Aquila chrysaetos chrysaetos]
MSLSLCPWVALVALVVLVQGGLGIAFTKVISVENGGPWGDWGDTEFCPENTYATGFQLKVEPHKGFFGDDTALNGIRLLCSTGMATANEGPWGSWSYPLSCGRSQRLVSFRLRVEAPRGLWDDTAANNLDITCSDGTVLEGQGGLAGVWGNWSVSCPFGWGICGLQTRVEPPQRGGDDTGLNDVKFFCCA